MKLSFRFGYFQFYPVASQALNIKVKSEKKGLACGEIFKRLVSFFFIKHALTIVHSKKLLGKATVTVYVDGYDIHAAQLQYPTLSKVC